MNIAIPVFGDRVMPRFGFTRELIVVTVEEDAIVGHKRLPVTPETWAVLPSRLRTEQVSVMICGGIHPRFQHLLQQENILLVVGVAGEWQAVVQAYLQGTLHSDPAFCLCRRKHRRRGTPFRRRQS
ncbi:hypothetical protein GF339_01860 [candidate division KSB3 bacterium]|uniref:Dinitrogenase iron-molybdenum cofactor biosynthesis domain-containing protein n=1 Tax=candidate division KSB3 bacterium TaxID=2044937 RepID=A0A9D5JS75_9BACT|nr:hypothetical protein [candidate division KSB3 bacterium]MBD3323297.1 hypothetical protein [candidate division KSB3 bacterium]